MGYNVEFMVISSVKSAICNCIAKYGIGGLTIGRRAATSRQNCRSYASCYGLREFCANGCFVAAQPAVGSR